jgi:hypothetical protein
MGLSEVSSLEFKPWENEDCFSGFSNLDDILGYSKESARRLGLEEALCWSAWKPNAANNQLIS